MKTKKRFCVGFCSPMFCVMAQFDTEKEAEDFKDSDLFKESGYVLNYIYDRKTETHINSDRYKWSPESDKFELEHQEV